MYTLGIDIGSAASKAAILRDGEELVGSAIIGFGAGTSGGARATEEVFRNAGLTSADIAKTVATGYGRMRYEGADKQISELSCHAAGVHFALPGVRTIIDIGGQDVKVLRLTPTGTLDNFVMNEKCAAGTGRFLDVMARVLETSTDQLGILDAQATAPVEISSTCTVFAESEVISHLSCGEGVCDIIAGIHNSVAHRTAGLARRLGVVPAVAMSGGVAQNQGVVRALSQVLELPIQVPEHTQLMGAIGAALQAYKIAQREKE